MKLGVCDFCKRDIIRKEYSDYTIEGCSDFCATASLDEKLALKDLEEGDFAVWPCSECGCAIQDEYVPGGHCSRCTIKVKLKEQDKKIISLQKEIEIAKNEAVLWKSEAEKAYEFNRKANEWWKFKLERIKLAGAQGPINLPWKKLAKKFKKEHGELDQAYTRLSGYYTDLVDKINTPKTSEFVQAVINEAAHQRVQRYHTDKTKTDADWFWLIGYLAGKALFQPDDNSVEKQQHRIVAVAAAACNWWSSKNKENNND